MRRLFACLFLVGCGNSSQAAPAEASPADASMLEASSEDAVEDVGEEDVPPSPPLDPLEAARASCTFTAGAKAKDTVGNLPAKFPLKHILVLMQENRSFDQVLGRHPRVATGEMDGFPADYANVAVGGALRPPVHATTGCLEPDPPHAWDPMHASWNGGKNDRFYATATAVGPGATAISYYEPADLPFYTWLYGEWASSDRYFCSVLGPTAPNRSFLVRGSSDGNHDAYGAGSSLTDAFAVAKVDYRSYGDTYGTELPSDLVPHTIEELQADLASGALPSVAFIQPPYLRSEHPPYDIREGERFVRDVVARFLASPAYATSALIVTYDESGGFFDHVPPPSACPPSTLPVDADFDRLGFRVPFALVSPYARRKYVSHRVHSHTSITRLLELAFDLPALTARDANSDALLDLFDFDAEPSAPPTVVPEASAARCDG